MSNELQTYPDKLDEKGLAAILRREYMAADAYHMQLRLLQLQSFRYYEGQPFGNEVEGRSQIVLPDVQETVDYMTQSVLRTFTSGDNAVEFEATDEEYEQAAREATAVMNYNFLKQQAGYRILHDGCVDGLIRKVGVFKTVVETKEKITRETVIATPDQLAMQLPEGAEIESETDNGDGTVTATLKIEKVEKVFVDYAVPTTEFRFSPNARHEDEADYLCHVSEKSRSELVEMGFDRDQVYGLPHDVNHFVINPAESQQLDRYLTDESSRPLEKVMLCEEYARIDLDNDGIAERVKVYRVETEILIDAETGKLAIETVEEQPFAVFCPFPRPHKMVGYSLADKVMDLQLARSFVARQLFDGMAFSNMPRPVVDTNQADADTYNDILSPIPGSPIRVKGGAAAVQPFQTGFDAGKSLQVLEWVTGERESRTGITRLNQGLDADTLNKTATGTALMQAQGQQGEEFIARNLAETVGRLFSKKYRLMKSEGQPIKVKVDGRYSVVDPASWPDEMNVMVRVGLGSGSKDKRIQYRMSLLQPMAEGLGQGLVSKKNAFNLIDGLARDMGIGQGDDYWIDPDSDEAQQQAAEQGNKPDPAMQAEMAKLDLERQKTGAQLQLQQQTSEAQVQAMREKHALEMEQKREAAALEAQLAREKADREAELEIYRINKESEIAAFQAHMTAQSNVEISRNRPGGDLDK